MTERFIVDDAGTLIDMQTRDMFDIVEEVCPLLNEQYETIQRLKQNIDELLSVDIEEELVKENEQLKDIIKDIVVRLDANHTSHTYQMTVPINKVIYNELKRRLKETSFNEELRRFLE